MTFYSNRLGSYCFSLLLVVSLQNPLQASPIKTQDSVEIKKTGCYAVYVERMPFWTFWNRNKIVRILAERTHQDFEAVRHAIDAEWPITITFDRDEAESLKHEVHAYNADIAIKEMPFVAEDAQQAEAINTQLSLAELPHNVDCAMAQQEDPDLKG